MHTDLKVGKFWGDMGVDFWDGAIWKQQVDKYEVCKIFFVLLHNCWPQTETVKKWKKENFESVLELLEWLYYVTDFVLDTLIWCISQ